MNKKVVWLILIPMLLTVRIAHAQNYSLEYNYTGGFFSLAALSTKTTVEQLANPSPAGTLRNPGFADFNRTIFTLRADRRSIGLPVNQVGFGRPLGLGSLFVSLTQSLVKDMELQVSEKADDYSHYSVSYMLANAGYSFNSAMGNIGFSLKIMYTNMHNVSAIGWAMDLGAKIRFMKYIFGFGSLKNLGPNMKFNQFSFPYPLELEGGLAFLNKYFSFAAALRNKMAIAPELFLSAKLFDAPFSPGFAIRCSMGKEYSVLSYSAFLNIVYKKYRLRYCFSVEKYFLNEQKHTLNLEFSFGKKRFRPFTIILKKKILAAMEEPTGKSRPIFFILRGQKIRVIEELNNEWYKVMNRFGKVGYIKKTQLVNQH